MSPQDDSSLLRPRSADSSPPVTSSQPSALMVSVAPVWTDTAVRPDAPVRLHSTSSSSSVETSSVAVAPDMTVIGLYPSRSPGSISRALVIFMVQFPALTKIGAKPCRSLPLMS